MLGLVADIGSTNSRFALVDLAREEMRLQFAATLPTADYPSLAEAIAAYIKDLPAGLRPEVATLAVAGPVSGDSVTLTNHAWSFSITALKQQLELTHLRVINDFTAASMALAVLPHDAFKSIGAVSATDGKCRAVIGPGTGLGMAALISVDGKYVPLASEGGHASFAPTTDDEIKLSRILSARFGRASNERLLSGPGLVNIYMALCELSGHTPEGLTPREIAHRAMMTADPVCLAALTHFCAILGNVAGDLALVFGADRLYVAGGIVPQILAFLEASPFRNRFENKGRFHAYMKRIPTYVVVDSNPGLLGAAFDLVQSLSRK